MNKALQKAMRTSRTTRPLPAQLKEILDAEQVIAQMTLDEHAEVRRQIERDPNDGILRLWNALALATQGSHAAACDEFLQASQLGCHDWRVGWYLAQSAKAAGNIPLVEEACEAVLRANPEFWFARELPKHARGYYAQGDHDQIIEQYFEQHAPRVKVFVEVGAFDGVHYSNVRRLVERHGWTGVSVEPVARNFKKLSESYRGRGVRCVQACASDVEGEVELNVSTYPHLPDWGSDVASVSGEDTERWSKQYGAVWTKEKVPARRLTSLLDEAGIIDIDLLSVDAEGHDLEVLRGLDFARFQPQLIVVEYGRHLDAIAAYLAEQGYSLQLDNKQDLFMAKPSSRRPEKADELQSPSSLDRFAPAERARILAATTCRDCDTVPKVANAGAVIPGDPPVQIMHNGVKILKGSYHGAWMTEIIRRLKGHHEPQEEKIFHEVLQTLPAKAVMIEAGSSWAYYSMWFHQAIPGAQNHLIEPNAEKFQLSQRHFALNGMKGTFTNGFIGSESHPSATFVDWDGRRYPLPQIAIDDYLRERDIPFVHILHADIQGAELDLLRGCGKSIAEGRIGYLFLSTHGDRHPACLEFLEEQGFHVVAEHTVAQGAAADGLIVARAKAFAGVNSVAITKRAAPSQKPQVDSLGKTLSEPELQSALSKLNPHLLQLNVLPIASGVRAGSIDPLRLVTPERFDIVVKHLYARHRALGVNTDWARELYHQHIRAFSNGTCREGDGRKNSIDDYFRSFDETIDSIGAHGFDSTQTLVPVGRNNVVIDGAHRVAACLFHRQRVDGLFFEHRANDYSAAYFRQRGLAGKFTDAVALEYCRLKQHTFIATIFPSAVGGDDAVRAILNGLGRVVYEKHVTLNRNGALNLIKQIYVGEKWLGDWSNNFSGAAGKADPCFRQPGPVRVFVFEADNLDATREAKQRIRAHFGIENHSVHINDTHEQTIYLGQILLNANSVHFLNHARPRHLERFHGHLALYAQMLATRQLNPEHFCVDGSAVPAAYGLRDVQDLDFLHFGCDNLQTGNRDLSSHNREIHHHVTTRDDIIFNPANHFYYFGIKFASLDIIRQLKAKRNEGKDQKDVAAIDRLLGNETKSSAAPVSHSLFNSLAPPPRTAPGPEASATAPTQLVVTRPGAKIVALVPARNEGAKIAFCFRALARIADAIVYLDDCSDDNTVTIVESIAAECRVERIIRKAQWHRDEPGDRNAMLKAGREIGGTHFIVIDADEAFTANCTQDEFLRRKILALAPGDQLVLTWIQLWRSVDQYRHDGSVWTHNAKPFVFCDDGQCAYSSAFIHTPRVPAPLKGRVQKIDGYTHGLLHFQFVNWRNLLVKQAWYRCLEHLRDPQKPITEINQRYAPSKDETGLGLKPAPAEWFAGYPFFDQTVFDAPDNWREGQILGWFEQYGREHFQELDIWDVQWGTGSPSPRPAPATGSDSNATNGSLRPTTPAALPLLGERAGVRADQNTDSAQDFIELAQNCFNRGELAPARDHLERARDLAPNRPDLLIALANLEFQLGDPTTAHQHLLKAIELQPNDAGTHVLLASVRLKLERIEEFEQSIARAQELNPNEPEALRLLATLNLQHGSLAESARNYFKLVQQNEGDVEALLGLGVCFFKQGDHESARLVFERVLQIRPGHELAQENLGACSADCQSAVSPTVSRQTDRVNEDAGMAGRVGNSSNPQAASLRHCRLPVCAPVSRYFQPPAGSTEQHIEVRPRQLCGATLSAFQALKDYDIRHTGTGLEAAERIFAHILKNKARTAWTPKSDFWSETIVVPVECELRSVPTGKFFDETQPESLEDISSAFAKSEAPRRADIESYVIQLRDGADLGSPAYVTGGLLKKLAPSAAVEPDGIYMIDGARRLTASALLHRRTVTVLLIMHEDEYAALLPAEPLQSLRQQLAALKWFESYQSIPLLGLPGHRTLRRFELMSLPLLRDQVVMDFGCNTGQACLKAVQAGAREVIGVEGMPDTFAGAQEIARLTGFANLRYANVNFNDADFERQIDAAWPELADYSFFFSVYRTKELTQRDRLFRYIIQKTRKGIFFEGHAAPKIDTLEYYEWLFESFGLKGRFLGTTEGELRPLFFIDLVASRQWKNGLTVHPHPGPLPQERERDSVTEDSAVSRRVPWMTNRGNQAVQTETNFRAPSPGGEGRGEGGSISKESAAFPALTPSLPHSPAPTPLVSAIVSTYANERFMEGRLKDLLAQTLGDQLEIIIVDSASPENEGAIVKRFMERHPNIRYIRTAERETIYQAWNRGIRAARGRYLTNANTDDRLRPDALERLAAELDAHPETALVYADFFITNTGNEEFLSHTRTGYSVKPDYSPAIMLDGCHIGPQPMWRRSLHDELGWFDESLVAAGDYEFWLRVATKYPLRHVPEFLGLYLHNAAGICNRNATRTETETAQVRAKYAHQFPPAPKDLPRGFFHRDAVKPSGFVNIGMVTYNRLDFTRRAIAALVQHTDFPHVLTVVDNASADGTREYLRSLRQLGVIKNLVLLDENVGVARASNLAWAQEPHAEFYLKLDNDIVLQKPGWLTRMVEVAERVPQVGVLAYNFEPTSYPLRTINRCVVRVKQRGNLGGACLLVPKRTERELGCWCEDYGLYGEEDADYAERVRLSGKLLAYMDDEDIGLHLPAGKAAAIDQETYAAADGVEKKQHKEYREWKDQLRKQNAQSGGAYHQNVIAYHQKTKPLRCESAFVKEFQRRSGGKTVVTSSGNSLTQPSATNSTSGGEGRNERPRPVSQATPAPSLPHSPAPTALVSIVIPVFNRLDMTQPCLEAIHRETKAGTFEIIVVDNASTDGTKEYLEAEQSAGRLRTIRNPENFGFARAINQGIQAARGEFVLMLNNDTVPLPGWLDAMLGEVSSDAKIGAVGACLLYPGGELIQHGGVAIGAGQGFLHPYHKHRLRRLDRVPEARQSRDCQAVTGACLLVRRSVVDRIGLLDEAYVNGFEDVDFCFRIITSGWRIRYCAESRVIHHESMTQGRKQHEEANYRRMNATWKGCITPDESAEETRRGIQDVLCREKLVQEPGHPRAMELLRDLAKARGDEAEAAEWSEKLANVHSMIDSPSPQPSPPGRGSQAGPSSENSGSSGFSTDGRAILPLPGGERVGDERIPTSVRAVQSMATPAVSIVIPTFNNLALTKQCLAALYKTTPSDLAEILVVDNGSVDGTVAFLQAEQAAGKLRALLNPTNLGFARGCNQGALAARGSFVLFLNNDTETTPGWLDAMLRTCSADWQSAVSQVGNLRGSKSADCQSATPQTASLRYDAGVVGCKLLYPDGSIQHAGIEWINGVPDHRFRHASADAPEVNQRREFDMVTGACFLMPKALFLDLGGFDEVYRNGVEDVDLCLRVRAAGYKVVYEPAAVVTHHEGKSQGRFNHVNENLQLFFARWKGQFDAQFKLIEPKKVRIQKSEKGLLVTPVNVSWDGSFLDLGSLSLVNRELTASLASQPLVSLTCLGKNAVPKPLANLRVFQDTARRLRAQSAQPAQVTVRHAWPPNWERPASGAWVLIQPWEFGSLPAHWLPHLERVDEIWAPSEYVRRVYVDSGVDGRKVHVVPNGIDPKQFHPGAKPMALATKKSFKFLFVGGTIQRKGPDILLKAYLENFAADDDVCLVIKDFGGQGVYAGQTFEAQIKAAQAKPNAPEILYLNSELPPEALPGLYTACDCLVHPYRGEGFGLPVLEAMACGLPVVVTAGGSTDDFATDDFAYRVPSVRREFGHSVSGMQLVKPGWMLEPDLAALSEQMQWVVAHREEARAKGRAASEQVRREWTWERAAKIAAHRLVELGQRPAKKSPPSTPPMAGAKPIVLPACAKLGHLGEARKLLRERKLESAWNTTVAALNVRPFHPEGFLLLAEIAQAAGDAKLVRDLAGHARKLAPKWKPAQQFSKATPAKSTVKVELPALPGYLSLTSRLPRLTVCLITKNEERFLGQCLESIRDVAQQIVVVDTGSTDWTRDIAARFGAEVYALEWCEDFSAARNAALERATGDWILFLDADEELLPERRANLLKLLNDPTAIAFRLPMIDKGREDEGVSHVPRLFRNAPGLFYVGRIHEQVFSSVEVRRAEWGLENKFGDATLLHHGYTKEIVQSRDKIARNLKLLEKALEEMPGEPNLLTNLGLELVRDGRLQEGLEQYAAAFAALSALPKERVTPELRESLLTQYCTHLLTAQNHAEIARVLQSPLAKSGGLTATMHWLFGLACIQSKLYADGAEQMRQCLAKRSRPALTPVSTNIRKAGPNHCLALCLAALKQREAANKAFQAALKDDPNARPVRFDYARFLAEGGHEVEALKWLHQLMAEDSSETRVWQFGGLVALSKPEFLEFAFDWTGEAIKLHPNHSALIEQRATALLLSGNASEARGLWQQLNPSANPTHRAALILCEALSNLPSQPVVADLAGRVNQEFVSWYRRLLACNASAVVQTLNQRLDALRQVVPAAAHVLQMALAEANAVPVK